jgi:hypothetical protein
MRSKQGMAREVSFATATTTASLGPELLLAASKGHSADIRHLINVQKADINYIGYFVSAPTLLSDLTAQ